MQKLLRESIVFSVPDLGIRVPVLEGTDSEVLAVAAGHFSGTGAVGSGNYCIAGHNSTIYAEIFNDLDQIAIGMTMTLTDQDAAKTTYIYTVTDYRIVAPDAVEILDDYGDDRLTVVTCTDDGAYRQVVVGMLTDTEEEGDTSYDGD
jgi:sortase A